jgi:hypothetical protein
MTVLSGTYFTRGQRFPVFGRPERDVLEFMNCPIVNDVHVLDRALETPRHDEGAVAERLLVE